MPYRSTATNRRVRVFISYCHKDQAALAQLIQILQPLADAGLVQFWSDGALAWGVRFEERIFEELRAADVVVLLASADYLRSEFCVKELQAALKQSEPDGLRVVPVKLGDDDVSDTPLKDLQCVAPDESWANVRAQMEDIVLDRIVATPFSNWPRGFGPRARSGSSPSPDSVGSQTTAPNSNA